MVAIHKEDMISGLYRLGDGITGRIQAHACFFLCCEGSELLVVITDRQISYRINFIRLFFRCWLMACE